MKITFDCILKTKPNPMDFKYIISIYCIIFLTSIAYSTRCEYELTLHPQSKSIFTDSHFILTGSMPVGVSLVKSFERRELFLRKKYGQEKIKLELLYINEGKKEIAQAVFKPIKELEANEEYVIDIKNLSYQEISFLKRHSSFSNKNDHISWKTLDWKTSDFENLKIDIKHVANESERHFKHAVYKVTNNYNFELWMKTELKNRWDGSLTTFIIPVRNNLISVGSSSCSGPFRFNYSANDEIRFTALFTNGDEAYKGNWTEIESPSWNQFKSNDSVYLASKVNTFFPSKGFDILPNKKQSLSNTTKAKNTFKAKGNKWEKYFPLSTLLLVLVMLILVIRKNGNP